MPLRSVEHNIVQRDLCAGDGLPGEQQNGGGGRGRKYVDRQQKGELRGRQALSNRTDNSTRHHSPDHPLQEIPASPHHQLTSFYDIDIERAQATMPQDK